MHHPYLILAAFTHFEYSVSPDSSDLLHLGAILPLICGEEAGVIFVHGPIVLVQLVVALFHHLRVLGAALEGVLCRRRVHQCLEVYLQRRLLSEVELGIV